MTLVVNLCLHIQLAALHSGDRVHAVHAVIFSAAGHSDGVRRGMGLSITSTQPTSNTLLLRGYV
jgi:hypothetical protein